MLKTLFDQEYLAKWYSQHINYPNIKEEHCLEVKGGAVFSLGEGGSTVADCEMDRFLHKLFLGNETNWRWKCLQKEFYKKGKTI